MNASTIIGIMIGVINGNVKLTHDQYIAVLKKQRREGGRVMHEDLIKRLRNCATQAAPCKTCDMAEDGFCSDTLMKQAADAIETLYAAYTESFSVIAKAFRNNPKDLVLREYMMKNACCCEVEEGK